MHMIESYLNEKLPPELTNIIMEYSSPWKERFDRVLVEIKAHRQHKIMSWFIELVTTIINERH